MKMKKKESFPIADDPASDSIENHFENRNQKFTDGRLQIEDDHMRQIASWIGKLPDIEPPLNLVPSVLRALQPKKLPLWRSFYRWANTPKSVNFTPLRAVPVVTIVIVAFILTGLLISSQKVFREGPDPGQHRVSVIFNLSLREARTVSVIGTFNSWNGQGYEMKRDGELNVWSLGLSLPEGRYEYGFLVDGQRVIPDPRALIYQDDGFGNRNSVLILRNKNGEKV
jgi:hypothetical protein